MALREGDPMLVLSRKPDESIKIGEQVQVRVIRIARGRVWLGIDAPRHLRIIRHEIQISRQAAEQRDAADTALGSDQ